MKKQINACFISSCMILLSVMLISSPQCYGQETTPIKIGLFTPRTGPIALVGQESTRAAEFAVKEINSAGGIGGRKIELITYDDRFDSKEAISISTRLADRDKVTAILAACASPQCVAAAPTLNSKRIPTVVTISNAFDAVIHTGDEKWIFRWASVGDIQGYLMVLYSFYDLGLRKFAVLIQDNEFGKGVANGAIVALEELKEKGAKIVYQSIYQTGEKEFRSSLIALKPTKPDIVISTGYGISHSNIVRQGTELGIFPEAKFFGN